MNLYTIGEIHAEYNVDEKTLINWIEENKIKAVKIAVPLRLYYIPDTEIIKILKLKADEQARPLLEIQRENVRVQFMSEEKREAFLQKYPGGYYEYIKSPEWKAKARQRWILDRGQCAFCHTGKNLQCHHITYENLGSEPMDDLVTLCEKCHAEVHQEDIRRKQNENLNNTRI